MKRKYNETTIATKLEILEEVDKKQLPKGEIAKKFGIPASTLSSILKNREKIEDAVSGGRSALNKRLRTAKYVDMEDRLFEYFTRARANNFPISGPVLQQKADKIALQLGIEGFNCSSGWLWRFQKRFNIVSLAVCGEAAKVDDNIIATWLLSVKPTLSKYEPRDVYNMDETGIFYNMLPNRTLALKGEKCHGGQRSKERLTAALCCNMDGSDKMKPLIVGKCAKPRCFKGKEHSITAMSATYTFSKKAWVTTKIFREWLMVFQRRMACQNRHVLLMLDNCSSHSADGMTLPNVTLLYLPPNTTSKLQPLDQGIIASLKKHYRRRLVDSLLRQLDRPGTTVDTVHKWDVLEAMRNIVSAWRDVTPTTIQNCFVKGGLKPLDEDEEVELAEEEDEEDEEWARVFTTHFGGSFNDYVNVVEDIATSAVELEPEDQPSNESQSAPGPSTHTTSMPSDDNDDQEDDDVIPRPTYNRQEIGNALSVIETVLALKDTSEATLQQFDGVAKFIREVTQQKLVQKTMGHFFQPSSST